jgi:preprotein translocase subunit SecA
VLHNSGKEYVCELLLCLPLIVFRHLVFQGKYPEKLKAQEELTDELFSRIMQHYKERVERIAAMAFPVIKNVYESQKNQYQNIVVPFTDGVKSLQAVTNLEKAYETQGAQVVKDFEKNITLALIDDAWKNHLRKLDDLRQYVQGAVYEQKDPLLIYKFESFELFKGMIDQLNRETLSFLFKGNIPIQQGNTQIQRAPQVRKREAVTTSGPGDEVVANRGGRPEREKPQTVVRTEKKYGRNEVVTIRNVSTGEQKSVKYKVAQPLVDRNEWVIED